MNDIEVLHDFHEALSAPVSAAVLATTIDDSITAIDSSIQSFVRKSMDVVSERYEFERELTEAVRARLPEANFSQVAAALSESRKDNADMTSRLVDPFAGIAVARAKVQLEASKEEESAHHSGDTIFKKSDKGVLQGLTALNQLLELANKAIAKSETLVSE